MNRKTSMFFNKSLAPTIAPEEQNYPRGKYPFKKSKTQKKGLSTGTAEEQARKHIDRELFIGHRYKVIWIGFLEGGSTLVTLDTKGYLYLWVYEKASFTSDLHFKPTIKLKLEINSVKFLLESSNRIFPEGKDKDINAKSTNFNPAIMDKIRTFMSGLDVPEMKEKSVTIVRNDKNQTTTFYIAQGEIPKEYSIGYFNEYVFNSRSLWIKASESKYQAQPIAGTIKSAKLSKDKRYMIVHMLRDHMFSLKDREMHEFLVVRLLGKRLNTMKVVLDFEKDTVIYYDISSEVPPYGIPYLYVIKGINIFIVSLITGQVVNKYDYSEIIAQNVKKAFLFDSISNQTYTNIYLASSSFDSILLFKLKNTMNYEEIDSFSRFNKIISDIWNAEGVEALKTALSQPIPS